MLPSEHKEAQRAPGPAMMTNCCSAPVRERSRLERVLDDVANEVMKAMEKHRPMNSLHEGKAVIEEELDELWDEIKERRPDLVEVRKESIQVAAMAVRLILDKIDE